MHRCRLVGAPGCAAFAWASECRGNAALRLSDTAADGDAAEDEAPARGTLQSLVQISAEAGHVCIRHTIVTTSTHVRPRRAFPRRHKLVFVVGRDGP